MTRTADPARHGRGRRRRRTSVALGLTFACLAALAAVPAQATAQHVAASPVAASGPRHRFTSSPLTPSARHLGNKSDSSRIARSDPTLLRERGSRLVRVMVKFDYDALASYRGSIPGLRATSPSVTRAKLSATTGAARVYTRYVVRREADLLGKIKAAVPAARVGTRLRMVYGGVAMQVPAGEIRKLAATKGVVAVQRDAVRKLLTDSSPQFIGAPTIWSALNGQATAGKGVIFGSLDSGAWPEHPSYVDPGNLGAPPAKADGTPRSCNFGDNPLTLANDPFVCNDKLISGQPFLDTYNQVYTDVVFPSSARDSNGHGSHTSTTAAGDQVASAKVFGIERGPVSGLAPGAHVAIYKVCGLEGCFNSDSVEAVGQAIADGVDVINFSISGGTQPTSDPVELAFLDAYAAGVFVAASAGNDGPEAATVEHLGPWVTSVAASTQTRAFQSTLTLTAPGTPPDSLALKGSSLTVGIGATSVVNAADLAGYDKGCSTPAPAGSFTGKIVVCERGGVGRVEKGFNVKAGGAVAMILYNPEPLETETDNHFLPTIHLEAPQGAQLLAFLAAHPATTGSFTTGEKAAAKGDVVTGFSSRGPGGTFLKPDIAAPGVQILAANTPVPDEVAGGPPGEYFQAIAGTSMAAPHIAGSGILLKALHPDWTPGQIKSALMTTATTALVKQDQTTPADPFDVGAGRVDLNRAGDPGLTFDESATRFRNRTGDPLRAIDLNIPSVNAPLMPGDLSTTRVAKNVSGQALTYDARGVIRRAGTSISVSPSHFTIAAGSSIRLTIRIKATAAPAGQFFGQVLLDQVGGARDLHLPVAFNHQQGPITLTSKCSSSTLIVRHGEACTITAQNNSTSTVPVDLHSIASSHELRFTGVSGAARLDDHNVTVSEPALAGKKFGTPALTSGMAPSGGYVDLSSFGVTPVPVTDEDALDFTVPTPFTYAGDQYTTIGLTSDGYAVVGGATTEDIQFEPQTLPDPMRPNNVLAPYWTDTTGDGAPGISATVLTDDETGENWAVAQWDVKLVTGGATQSFQLWIGLNGTEDISFKYDPTRPVVDPGPLGLTVGAENSDGSGGDQLSALPTEDVLVTTSGAGPGAKVTYRVGILGVATGPGRLVSVLSSPAQLGNTVAVSKVAVVPRPG